MAFLTDLALTALAAWAATTALYFGLGLAIRTHARRHPERRIQAGRDGEARAGAEIRESLRSIAVTSLCLALAVTLARHGLTLWAPWEGWIGALGGAALLILGYDLYYYAAHRLLHTKRFVRFHRWHHQSRAPTVWSTDSQSPAETLLIQSWMVWAALLLPVGPAALLLHRLYDHVNGQFGHCGYEFFADRTTRAPSPMVCTTYHDQHHEFYNWNFGNFTSVWDRMFGTLHPDYDRIVAARAAATPPAPAE